MGDYAGWFGFDSIPVLAKANPAVQEHFRGIARLWLERGAGGWRMDVSGDPSFPNGYWEAFRQTVKSAKPDALTVSETWGKDTTLLRMLRGDRLDTTMNYRLRDAVIGLFAPQGFDSKGFPDSGRQLAPSEFASRLESIREDYADAAYFSAMNLLDSHDTERLRWTLTPGAETREAKEQDAGERRRREAAHAARLARPVHGRRRADRVLRRRGRRHRRRRPGRPAHDALARDGRRRATSRCSRTTGR